MTLNCPGSYSYHHCIGGETESQSLQMEGPGFGYKKSNSRIMGHCAILPYNLVHSSLMQCLPVVLIQEYWFYPLQPCNTYSILVLHKIPSDNWPSGTFPCLNLSPLFSGINTPSSPGPSNLMLQAPPVWGLCLVCGPEKNIIHHIWKRTR